MKVQCLLFDCDGVLIDSEVLWNRAEAEIKTELGFPISLEEQYRRFVGLSHDSHEIKAERAKLPPNYKDLFKKRYEETLANELKAVDGMEEIVRGVKVPTAVVSNSTEPELVLSLGKVGLLPFFEKKLYSSFLLGKPKPDPAIYLYACNALGFKPAECLVIEDSQVGVRAAKSAGMTVYGFYGATHFFTDPSQRLFDVGAHKTFAHAKELAAELKLLGLIG